MARVTRLERAERTQQQMMLQIQMQAGTPIRRVVLQRRGWLARLLRVPGLILAHHRLGVPWGPSIRLALVILR